MRQISQTKAFKRDLKREAKGLHKQSLSVELLAVIESLALDKPLAQCNCIGACSARISQ
jgi:mRNA interferase YafQ